VTTVVAERDVRYADDDDVQMMDLYWPGDSSLMPSGGWSAVIMVPSKKRWKSDWATFCTDFIVPTGRLCVAADYRKEDDVREQDVFELSSWLHRNAARWNVNRENIVLAGESVGGSTVNRVLWHSKFGKELLRGSTPKVKAAMLLSGTWENHSRQAKKASYFPQSTYICGSEADTTFLWKWAKNLATELRAHGQSVKLVNFQDAGHDIWNSDQRAAWMDAIVAFLDETVPGAR